MNFQPDPSGHVAVQNLAMADNVVMPMEMQPPQTQPLQLLQPPPPLQSIQAPYMENEVHQEPRPSVGSGNHYMDMLATVVNAVDPMTLWRATRQKVWSQLTPSELTLDFCTWRHHVHAVDTKMELQASQTLKELIRQTGDLINELCMVLQAYTDEMSPEEAMSDAFAVLVDHPQLVKCLNKDIYTVPQPDKMHFRLKPLESLEPSLRSKLVEGFLEFHYPVDENHVEIKLETFDDNVDGHGFDIRPKPRRPKPKSKTEVNKTVIVGGGTNPDGTTQPTHFKCSLCSALFMTYKKYNYHRRFCGKTRKRKRPPPFVKVEGRYYCAHPDCLPPQPQVPNQPKFADEKVTIGENQEFWESTKFIWKHFSKTHATEVDLDFECSYCEDKFLTKGLLNRHIFSKHERRYTCKFCNQCFPTSSSLQKHERVHTGEKPFACRECDFKCSRLTSLRLHERRRHGNETLTNMAATSGDPTQQQLQHPLPQMSQLRVHTCDVCGRSFPSTQALQDHHVTHTGARPYMCQLCGKTLRNDSCLRRHMMAVHGIKHTCELCGKEFSSKRGLLHHQRDFHGLTI